MTSHFISLTTISFSNHQIYHPTFFCMKCLFLYQRITLANMLRIPLLALLWLFFFFLVILLLLSYSITFSPLNWIIPIITQVCIIQNSLNSTSFSIYCLIFLLLITVKHLRKFVTLIVTIPSPLFHFSVHVSLSSVHTTLLKLLLSRLPTTSYRQIQSYFSVFI